MDPSVGPLFAGGRAAARHAPTVIDFLKTGFGGKRVAIIGPPAAGKSCFTFYIQSGELRPNGYAHRETLRTKNGGLETIPIGSSGRFKVRIRRSSELPGQLTPLQITEELVRLKPQVLIIILDHNEGEVASKKWLSSLREPFRAKLFNLVPKKRIKKLVIVGNKIDLNEISEFHIYDKALYNFVSAAFRGCFEPLVIRRARIMPCSAVRTKAHGVSLVEDILREIMED